MYKALPLLALALCACGGGAGGSTPPVPPSLPPAHKTVAVVGDSISRLQVLPTSPVPCGWPTSAVCSYSTDGSLSYPTLLAKNNPNLDVVNLSVPGALAVGEHNGIPDVLSQVGSIPLNASAVIIEAGTNDISVSGMGAVPHIAILTKAVRDRVPAAKLLFVGVRYFEGCDPSLFALSACRPTAVDAWDAEEAALGTLIDTRSTWPAGASVDWPDGTHPGQGPVQTLAATLALYL